MMYNVVVWSGFQAMNWLKPLVGVVRSCKVASESFDQFNRLAAALAKSQDRRASLGVFSFGADRQGALAKRPAWAAPKKHRQCVHPASVRPALIERLVKDWVQRWNQGPIYKRINPSWALGSSGHRPQDRSGVGHIHPWRCYV